MTSIRRVRLGEVARFLRGINFKPGDVVPLGTDGTVACMRTKNIQEMLDCHDVWGVSETFVRRPEQMLNEGDILVSSANSWNLVGKCCWIPDLPWRTTFGGFVSALRADTRQLDSRFLYWWFSWDRTQALLRSCGQKTTSISNLNVERSLNLSMPLPPLAEQRRIAAILDQADSLRAKRREALSQLDCLTQSIFIEMFGDPVSNPKNCVPASLGDAVSEMQYGPRFYNEAYSPEGMRIVRITDLNASGELDFNSMPRMDLDKDTHAQFILHPGDILFARTGATVGKVALIDQSSPPCIAGAYFIRLRFKGSVLPEYAYSVLRTKSVQSLIAGQSRQAAQQNFSGPGLRRLPMSIPSLALQQEFRDQLTVIQQLTSVQQKSLAHLSALFASLQHRAFRGEL